MRFPLIRSNVTSVQGNWPILTTQFFYSAIFFFTALLINAESATYFVKPSGGSDSFNGTTLETAFATPNKATSVAIAGDLIKVKGGKYVMSSTIKFSNDGTAGNLIKLFAEPGETPEFDFSNLTSGRGIEITRNFIHIKGVIVSHPFERGITVKTEGVILEGVTVHHAGFDGFCLTGDTKTGAKNTLVLNCDSYLNWETGTDGNNGDGFAAKDGGTGNVFRGCRAWLNADDGWDTYGNVNPVLIDSCWAFRNGYNVFGYSPSAWKGNGNGFKLGAAGPNNAENIIVNSFAFGNVSKGFDQNHNTMGLTVLNCTGYMNFSSDGNFAFQDSTPLGTLKHHILKNNLSIPYPNTKLFTLAAGTEEVTNSWILSLTLSESDFVSLDTSLATKPRNPDYSIPNTGLFRLKSSNPAIDKGTSITYTFDGKAHAIPANSKPDLGAFEYTGGTSVKTPKSFSAENLSCKISTESKAVTFSLSSETSEVFTRGAAHIFNGLGKEVQNIVFTSTGLNSTTFNWNYENSSGNMVAKGTYFVRIVTNKRDGQDKPINAAFIVR